MLQQSLQTISGCKLFIRQTLKYSLLKKNRSEAASNVLPSTGPKSETDSALNWSTANAATRHLKSPARFISFFYQSQKSRLCCSSSPAGTVWGLSCHFRAWREEHNLGYRKWNPGEDRLELQSYFLIGLRRLSPGGWAEILIRDFFILPLGVGRRCSRRERDTAPIFKFRPHNQCSLWLPNLPTLSSLFFSFFFTKGGGEPDLDPLVEKK